MSSPPHKHPGGFHPITTTSTTTTTTTATAAATTTTTTQPLSIPTTSKNSHNHPRQSSILPHPLPPSSFSRRHPPITTTDDAIPPSPHHRPHAHHRHQHHKPSFHQALTSCRETLSRHTCYDTFPTSTKVVVLDTGLTLEKSVAAMVQNAMLAVPLWSSPTQSFAGLLTIYDIIRVILSGFRISDRGDDAGTEADTEVDTGTDTGPEARTGTGAGTGKCAGKEAEGNDRRRRGSTLSSAFTKPLTEILPSLPTHTHSIPLAVRPLESLEMVARYMIAARERRPQHAQARRRDQDQQEQQQQEEKEEKEEEDGGSYMRNPKWIPIVKGTCCWNFMTAYAVIKFLACTCESSQYLDQPIGALNIGTYADPTTGTAPTGTTSSLTGNHLHTTTLTTPVLSLLTQFLEGQVGAVPVINEYGEVVNAVQLMDVLGLVHEWVAGGKKGTGTAGGTGSGGGGREEGWWGKLTVADVLRRRSEDFPGIYSCTRQETLSGLLEAIGTKGVQRFMVVDDELGGTRLEGVVSAFDILRFLAGEAEEEGREEGREGGNAGPSPQGLDQDGLGSIQI